MPRKFLQFTGGVGEFFLSVRLLDDTGQEIGKSGPSRWELSGGNHVYEEVFHLTRVPFVRPGLYEFKLMGNHAELEGGTAYLRVLPG